MMFLEPSLNHPNKQRDGEIKAGWIEVICGCMFSGKTEELIRRTNRALIAKQSVQIFKPAMDVRYDNLKVVSHNKNKISSTPVKNVAEILEHAANNEVIAIDEAQFFGKGLLEVATELANSGKRVIISGLDMDFEGVPFNPIPELMSIAEFVTKLHAICVQCGRVAHFSYRLIESYEKVLLGETNTYEARCRHCFHKGMLEKEKHKRLR